MKTYPAYRRFSPDLKIILLIFIHLAFTCSLKAQEKQKPKLEITARGYVKYMNTTSFFSLDSVVGQNLIHHRLNLRGYLGSHWTAGLEVRNRIFYGAGVAQTPGLGQALEMDAGMLDMSWTLVDRKAFVIHSTLDRAWLNYQKGKFEARLGRQRINWGINTVWNPNDLFNAFNYLEFDYEERPGADAIRLQYYTGALSGIELAYAPGKDLDPDQSVAALMYRFNKKNYDIQILAGNYRTDLALGTGWAGSIKDAGFKGEATYFHPRKDLTDTLGTVSATVSLDYSFNNGIYVMGSFLYNSRGLTQPVPLAGAGGGAGATAFGNISAKSLMPARYSTFASVSGQFNPLIGGNMAGIYSPGLNLLLLSPTLTYSLSDSWELMLLGQIFFNEDPAEGFAYLGSGVFFRAKWSY